jgi:hypothetical protein
MYPDLPGVVLLALYGCLFADISPVPGTLPVAPVYNAADLVCNCVVEKTEVMAQRLVGEGRKAVTQQQVSAIVKVEDEYKSVRPGVGRITLEFEQELPPTSVSTPSVDQGERALMFLKTSGGSRFVFADRFLAAIPFDNIPKVSEAPGLDKLQAALVAISRSSNPQDQVRAMELLNGFDDISAATVSAISQAVNSARPKVALAALSVLLKAGTESGNTQDALLRLSAYLQTRGDSPEETLANIGSELGRVNDAGSLELVEALSGSKSVAIRRGALQSLRFMKNPAASKTLVMRLDDNDGYVRYLSVMTLAETFGKYGDYAPTMNVFDQNPEFYVGLWKSWWQAEQGFSSK